MEKYKGFEISTNSYVQDNTKMNWWLIFENGTFIQQDWCTMAGEPITNEKQAMNEAKKTIDAWIRMNLI